MASHLSPDDQILLQRIDEVLHYVWDPLGIATLPEARDEYAECVQRVWPLVRDGAGPDRIAAELSAWVLGPLGLPDDEEHHRHVAEVLMDWRQALTTAAPAPTDDGPHA